MKKLTMVGSIIGILACMVGVYFYLGNDSGLKFNLKKNDPVTAKEAQTKIEKGFEAPVSGKIMAEYETMSEEELIQEVHNMTHQKVEADKKWGASEITADKVKKIYEVIKNKDFKKSSNKQMLLDILEPWTRQDFSNAVSAHNRIWAYQKGNIGKATRLLTPQEELEYIEDEFR
ncbi:hypothetical protein MLOOGBEN_02370 [Bacillus sp. EB106-08-02-XG196]|jgi:hypothetical protein|uniref:DUF6241 domain-containing protein n=1 Tax=Bacillus sp. EB106-08-02-XG196 TaxID=2737049 RepID=UPI0015C45916|nr:DUF6241 domain-containing protein [Bacillus sp. EB106-08-02-XG196]NWQ39542.1 hypothetical protein [Bacillus sp. EB106-08-02-XG196]